MFFVLFLNFLLHCFYNVVMEIGIVKYSLVDIFHFFFLLVEIAYSSVLFVRCLVPETLRCIGWQESFGIIRSVLLGFLLIAVFLTFVTSCY